MEAASCTRGTAQLQLHFEARRVSVGRPEITLQAEGAGREGSKPGDGWKEKREVQETAENIMSRVSWSAEGNKVLKE